MFNLDRSALLSPIAIATFFVAMNALSTCVQDVSARGVIAAVTEATIAVEYTPRIRELPFQEGQAFHKSDVLITFDCSRYQADVTAVQASAHAKELVAANNRRLLSHGAIGSAKVEVSVAELQKSRAEVLAVQARTGSCDFRTPFDGRLVERVAQEYESPAPNQPLIKIVDTTNMEIEIIVPSKWLIWLEPESELTFSVDETGQMLTAKVARMGAIVDPVSQTIRDYGSLMEKNSTVLPGMSGTATFNSVGS